MSTPLHHFCNREFTEELEELVERNVLLFMLDGSVIFGRITRFCDCVATILPAIGINGYYGQAFPFVQFRPPNGTLFAPLTISEVDVDVCNIAAVIEGPFVLSPLAVVNGFRVGKTPLTATSFPERKVDSLEEELKELEGQNIGVSTLGGWTFGGQLGDVDDCIVLIGSATTNFPPALVIGSVVVFGPAFPGGSIVLTGNFHAWINLKAVVQVLLP
ncbi:hypothetical protein SDC9_168402 [bioreactor metagenome]|uniref:Uncharacterized protein n=1 Tax=bioreactor metagenome TaxID=1076179 RepID=A0A645GAW3_9ZZZZ